MLPATKSRYVPIITKMTAMKKYTKASRGMNDGQRHVVADS